MLAALADVLVVGGGHLLGLVARQLDAAPQVGRDGRLVPALPEEGVDGLDLVPSWNTRQICLSRRFNSVGGERRNCSKNK